jgi:uncharacterized protein YyaL (SSP411 family)
MKYISLEFCSLFSFANYHTKIFLLISFIITVISGDISMINSKNKSVSNSDRTEKTDGLSILTSQELSKLPPDGGANFNRLIFEKSPYLLQHASNPVDWYPWGEEAFKKAKNEDKPVFLSIGYSTCHWCHVMEHESFEDPQVATLMNEAFVCIKVDREERPDIDQIYMTVCQAMTGSGGWPLTVIMTPDKQPFFAGTYFPKESRYQRIGMKDLVSKISELWENERAKLLENADQVTTFLKKNSFTESGEELKPSILNTAYQQLNGRFDDSYGGFGSAPKFPSPHNLIYLLRYWHRTGEGRALEMAEKTLQQMRLGGLFDQVGFGFHRYSTDAHWLLPHFEKMLYDQAMLAMAYLECYQATCKKEHAQTAREIFTYVLRDMTSLEGGFYSAEDADSEGEEGLFYLWTTDEIKAVLGKDDGEFFMELFNLNEEGNFAEEASGKKTRNNIPHLKKSLGELAREKSLPRDKLMDRWEEARRKLFAVREKRIHPLKDDKILTDWNGLMIAALAKGAAVLDEAAYIQAAEKAVDFVWEKLRDGEGRLLKRYRQGEAGLPAHLDDYAFMVWGLLELYETTFTVDYLHKAIELNEQMVSSFWDQEKGGFYFTTDSLGDLLIRTREIYDGAIPSGNSVAAFNLIRLGRMTANPEFEKKALAIGRAFSQQISQVPLGHTHFLSALNFAFGPSNEVVVAGKPEADDTKLMIRALRQNYSPHKVVLFRPSDSNSPDIVKLAGFTEFQTAIDGKATAYVCQNYACNAPTTDIEEMVKLLQIK